VKNKIAQLLIFNSFFVFAGCNQGLKNNFNFDQASQSSQNDTQVAEPGSGDSSTPVPTNPPAQDQTTPTSPSIPNTDPTAGLCRTLDFNGIQWPSSLSINQQRSLALALTISGSYEGRSQWSNITNNFDKQGMSLGLLQQNFGTGSLQPLLFKMHSEHFNEMKSFYVDTDFKSLEQMILNWKSTHNVSGLSEKISTLSTEELFPVQTSSPLDIEDTDLNTLNGSNNKIEIMAQSAEMNWVLKTVYSDSGTTFIPRWKNSFQNMAKSSGYRSLQVQASTTLYNRALSYFKYFGFKELRSFLFTYDVVVQNGSFSDSHKNAFNSYLKSNPSANETQKALKLLEIRLTSVKPPYVNDVRSRKQTIINGTGKVHGENRNLPQEYCFNLNENL